MSIYNRHDSYQKLAFERKFLESYVSEYLQSSLFDYFTGSGPDKVISVIQQNSGEGSAVAFNMQQFFNSPVKTGEEKLMGTADGLTFAVDRVTLHLARFSVGITNQVFQELEVATKFIPSIVESLNTQQKNLSLHRVLQSFGNAFRNRAMVTENINIYANSLSSPVIIRSAYQKLRKIILDCCLSVDGSNITDSGAKEYISANRVVTGNTAIKDPNKSTTIKAAIKAICDTNPKQNILNEDHLERLKCLAEGSSLDEVHNDEAPIRPYSIKTGYMNFATASYVLFTSEAGFRALRKSEEWQGQTTRGVIEDSQCQPSILAYSAYRGKLGNIMVVVVPEFSQYIFTPEEIGLTGDAKTKNIKVAYSALVGGQAFGLATTGYPKVTTEVADHGMIREMAHTEISGIKALKMPSKADPTKKGVNPLRVDLGIIHSFTVIDNGNLT